MFSFMLSKKDQFFVARDPIGIKPLYWGFDDENIYFSSEIKALRGEVGADREVDGR